MPNVGPLELAIVLIIALVIFGPKRLPELGRSMGKGIREFRSSVSEKDKDEESAPAEIEGAQDADEPVEGEVVTHRNP
jgi:sec-independent protein translocase protein TatA